MPTEVKLLEDRTLVLLILYPRGPGKGYILSFLIGYIDIGATDILQMTTVGVFCRKSTSAFLTGLPHLISLTYIFK